MNDILKVFSKELKTANGGTFTTHYGYRQQVSPEGAYSDIGTPAVDSEGKAIIISKPIKVKFSEEMFNAVNKLHFPIYIELDRDMKLDNGESAYFVTVDKDKDKNARLDKHGKRHLVCVIRKAVSVVEAPMESRSLDDLDDFE